MKLRALIVVLAASFAVVGWMPEPARADGSGSGAAGGSADGADVTLEGEVLDLSCYLTHGRKGRGHRTCAKRCAERGLPIGLLTDDGQVYLFLEDHADEAPYEEAKKHAGKRVKVSGKAYGERGLKSIVLNSTEGL